MTAYRTIKIDFEKKQGVPCREGKADTTPRQDLWARRTREGKKRFHLKEAEGKGREGDERHAIWW